jgi:hypothetical protein
MSCRPSGASAHPMCEGKVTSYAGRGGLIGIGMWPRRRVPTSASAGCGLSGSGRALTARLTERRRRGRCGERCEHAGRRLCYTYILVLKQRLAASLAAGRTVVVEKPEKQCKRFGGAGTRRELGPEWQGSPALERAPPPRRCRRRPQATGHTAP